jgi:sugar lactone lactonase YvrE
MILASRRIRRRLPALLICLVLCLLLAFVTGLQLPLSAQSAATPTPTEGTLPGPSSQGKREGSAGQKSIGEITFTIGGEGTGPGKFDDPRTIAIDDKGFIYVAEYTSGRIQRFDSAGNYVSAWIVEFGQDNGLPLRSLAADRSGSLYVVRGGGVIKYTGETATPLTTRRDRRVNFVDKVAALPDDSVLALVVRADAEELYHIDAEGKVIGRAITNPIRSRSKKPELSLEMAVGLDGKLYIGSSATDTLYVMAVGSAITLDKQIEFEGLIEGSLDAVAVDAQGQIYIGDWNSVKVFDADGKLLQTIPLSTPGEVVRDLAFDQKGTLYVVTSRSLVHRIKVAEATGR